MAFALASRSSGRKPASVVRAVGRRPARTTLGTLGRPEGGVLGTGPALGASSIAPAIQAKLEIGAPNDRFEQEADRVADQVMRMPGPAVSATAAPPQISRKCAACEDEEKLQKKAAGPQAATSDAPVTVRDVLRSPGQPLDPVTRNYFESRFRHDFGRVRVHSGTAAEQSARDVNAHAYTVGHDMVFGAGRFAPGRSKGGGCSPMS